MAAQAPDDVDPLDRRCRDCYGAMHTARTCPFRPQAPTPTQKRFASLLDLAEKELRENPSGPTAAALVAELQAMSAGDGEADILMGRNSRLAQRFDAVVAAWKEHRGDAR